jgi:hypothetical protein
MMSTRPVPAWRHLRHKPQLCACICTQATSRICQACSAACIAACLHYMKHVYMPLQCAWEAVAAPQYFSAQCVLVAAPSSLQTPPPEISLRNQQAGCVATAQQDRYPIKTESVCQGQHGTVAATTVHYSRPVACGDNNKTKSCCCCGSRSWSPPVRLNHARNEDDKLSKQPAWQQTSRVGKPPPP